MFSRIGVQALFIERGSCLPRERQRQGDELLNRETFYTLMEAHEIVVAGKADLE
jgi:hypothetical protein